MSGRHSYSNAHHLGPRSDRGTSATWAQISLAVRLLAVVGAGITAYAMQTGACGFPRPAKSAARRPRAAVAAARDSEEEDCDVIDEEMDDACSQLRRKYARASATPKAVLEVRRSSLLLVLLLDPT